MQIGLCEEYQVKIEHFILEFVESITVTTEHQMRRENNTKSRFYSTRNQPINSSVR